MSLSIISDLKYDCEKLVNSYVALNSTSFSEFVSLWKSLQFDFIFAGQGEGDIDYFIFHVFHIAKSFCDVSNAQPVRVAGLYLLYLLYYTQPLKIKKSIRLTPNDLLHLKALALHYKYHNKEVSYAFYKLMLDNAFEFVVTSLPYDENFIHFKEELKVQGQMPTEVVESRKIALERVFREANFDTKQWTKLVTDYNNIKKKINNSCSLNLKLTKEMAEA